MLLGRLDRKELGGELKVRLTVRKKGMIIVQSKLYQRVRIKFETLEEKSVETKKRRDNTLDVTTCWHFYIIWVNNPNFSYLFFTFL